MTLQAAHACYERGRIARCADRWDEAGEQFRAALCLIDAHPAAEVRAERQLLAAVLSGLAETDALRGDLRAALRLLLAGHRRVRRLLGPDAPELGRLFNDRGVLWKSLGRLGLAHDLYRRAAALLPLDGNDRATLLHNLGGIEFARGNLAEAETFTREGLGLRNTADRAALASDQAALAAILRERGTLAEAEALYRAAIDGFTAALGEDNHEMALAREGLALVLGARGDAPAGRDLLARAVASQARRLGPAHPDLGILLANLGVLTARCGDRQAAVQHLVSARDILVGALGDDHPHTRRCLAALDRLVAG